MKRSARHTCSLAPESCPSCGYNGTRDEFEGWEARNFAEFRQAARSRFTARCPKCEDLHPDQSNWDLVECGACDYD